MFSPSKSWNLEKICHWAIGIGALLRLMALIYFPPGYEGDEAAVIYWGRRWITEGHFTLLSNQELPAWETPSAYFFGGLDLLGISPRFGSLVLSYFEMGLSFLWIRKLFDRRTALLGTAFLALMPWHFYFSFATGPCVAGLWTSLYLLKPKNPIWRALSVFGGLIWYASFRVLVLWESIRNLFSRKWKFLFLDFCGASLLLVLLGLMGREEFEGFFMKGSYLFERGLLNFGLNYFNAILLWWVPPLQLHLNAYDPFIQSDLNFGMATALRWLTPLSLGTSLFFALGLFKYRRQRTMWQLVSLFLLSVLFVGFAPGYVHFPFLLPVVAAIAGYGALQWIDSSEKWGIRGLQLSFLISILSIGFMFQGILTNDRADIFTGRSEKLYLKAQSKWGQAFIWTSGTNFHQSRLQADRAHVPLIPMGKNFEWWLSQLRMSLRENKTNSILVQGVYSRVRKSDEFHAVELAAYQRNIDFLEQNSQIRSKEIVIENGIEIGRLYEIEN